jgi:hypothetical protein
MLMPGTGVPYRYRPQYLNARITFQATTLLTLTGPLSAICPSAHARGSWCSFFEGGCDLETLAASVHACLEVLAGRQETFPSAGIWPGGVGVRSGDWPRLIAASRAAITLVAAEIPDHNHRIFCGD